MQSVSNRASYAVFFSISQHVCCVSCLLNKLASKKWDVLKLGT